MREKDDGERKMRKRSGGQDDLINRDTPPLPKEQWFV